MIRTSEAVHGRWSVRAFSHFWEVFCTSACVEVVLEKKDSRKLAPMPGIQVR